MEQPELIEVRPDEAIPVSRLADYLRPRLSGTDGALTVSQFGGGHANLTYLLDFAGTEYVLRRPPLGPVAPRSHDMGREFFTLSRLWRAFPLAPRAYLLCEDPAIIGAPFFVMERRRGIVVRGQIPTRFGGGDDPVANRKLSEVVVNALASFHSVDPGSAGLDNLGRPDGFLQRQVSGWIERWNNAKQIDNPVVDELAVWLQDHLPNSPPPTLVHNDWRLDNIAIDPNDPGKCVAVYDWDMATRGDQLADLGSLLAAWYEPDEVPATLNPMPTFSPGFLRRQQAIDLYAAASGQPLDAIDWYITFGTFRLGVILQQIYIRWQRGQTQDERFATMGDGAQTLFELAAARRP